MIALAASTKATEPLGYQLTWFDEFDGVSLDESAWLYRADEKQQSIQLPSNVEVANGTLILNLTPLETPINGFDAAGAGVITRQRFRYGYYEVRSRLGDGIDDDNDGPIDEGWWHAFWAMAAEATPEGTVSTTFPDIRRTEIDAYENGSNNLTRFTQHVLPWNEQGQIIARLPSNDVSTIPAETVNDWHTYGFEWTPNEVKFFVDDVYQHSAVYRADEYDHTDVNVWLTAISTNGQSSDQELSSATYDYFRFYEPGTITVASGEQLAIGPEADFASAPVGGSLIVGPFGGGGSGGSPGTVAGAVIVNGGGLVSGTGELFGNLTPESGGLVRIGGDGIASSGATGSSTTVEDFESFTPSVAFESNSPTGLLPNWTFYDLGSVTGDVRFEISGADTTPSEPSDSALTGESQMLFQSATGIDFATEAIGNEPFAGAVAVTNAFDTSGRVDVIEADFVFDGYGDPSGNFLDTKLVFGFRDIDNWFNLSIVAGGSDGTNTQVDVIANVDGERENVFGRSGTGTFGAGFPTDRLLTARVTHDAQTGYIEFRVVDTETGEILAESFVVDQRFAFDGDVGFGVNNDATGYDNLRVTTLDSLPFTGLQTLTIDGDFSPQAGATLEIDLLGASTYDRLELTGAANLAGVLELAANATNELQLGDLLLILDAEGGIFNEFDQVLMPDLGSELALELRYGETGVAVEVALAGDFDRNGVVDASDFTIWRNQAGATVVAGTLVDPTGDGVVNQQDYLVWAANYGNSLAAATAVPEPSGWLGTLAAMAAISRRQNRS